MTGDGGHQLTAQEIGVMGFTGVSPVVIVLNNGLYGVEALISEVGHAYKQHSQLALCRTPQSPWM